MKASLIDVFLHEKNITVWLRKGKENLFLKDSFRPAFYCGGKKTELTAIADLLCQSYPKKYFEAKLSKKKDFTTNKSKEVLKITLNDFSMRRQIVDFIKKKTNYSMELYNTDIGIEQLFLFEKNLRPLQQVEFNYTGEWLQWIKPVQFEAFTEQFPELSTVEIEIIETEGRQKTTEKPITAIRLGKEFFRGTEKQLLLEFKKRFLEIDADIVLTVQGNKFLVDYLKKRMLKNGIFFNFGRFKDKFFFQKPKSYFSYGRIIHREAEHYFKGRLHLETNGFHLRETGLQGVLETAFSSGMPIQKAGHKTSGTCISNLQLFHAIRKGYLVPEKKNHVEQFNSVWHLFEVDKGGLVFEPLIGLHENVAELDFSSLYPSIMVVHNISCETILCNCCKNNIVPEAGYNICEKRIGLIPQVLKGLLDRRLYFKKMKTISTGEEKKLFDAKAKALKWLLVTSFGYTGYKNARFGRIEAHQSICAFAREKLLQTIELCEEAGFEIVHAIVDAVYIKKKGFRPEEIEELIKKISKKTKVEIVLEGIFNWIVFLPSAQNEKIATCGKFFGAYNNGEMKIRGIHLRKRDTPMAVKKMQAEQLQALSGAKNRKEFLQKIPIVVIKMKEWSARLQNELIPLEDLAVSISVSRKAKDYKANCAQKTALLQLEKKGITVFEGETVKFVHSKSNSAFAEKRVTAFPAKDARIDLEKYEELFIRATQELLGLFGYSRKALSIIAKNQKQTMLADFSEKIAIKAVESANNALSLEKSKNSLQEE